MSYFVDGVGWTDKPYLYRDDEDDILKKKGLLEDEDPYDRYEYADDECCDEECSEDEYIEKDEEYEVKRLELYLLVESWLDNETDLTLPENEARLKKLIAEIEPYVDLKEVPMRCSAHLST